MTDKLSPFWLALLLAFVLKAFFVVFGTPVVPFLVGILLGCCALGTAVHFGINVLESLVKEHIVKLLNAKAEKPESKPSFYVSSAVRALVKVQSKAPKHLATPSRWILLNEDCILAEPMAAERPASLLIKLRGCTVSIVQAKRPSKNLWKKCSSHVVFIFFQTGRELEEWYYACYRRTQPSEFANVQGLFYEIHDRVQESVNEEVESTWFNAVIHRIFFHFHNDPRFLNMLEKQIQKQLDKVRSKPKFPSKLVTKMEVLNVNFGSNLPILDNWKLLQSTPEGIVKAICDGTYSGGFEIKLRVELQIHLPPLSPRVIPIIGTIHVDSLTAQLFLHITGPPSNCFWFAFTKKPKIKTSVDVSIGLSATFGMVNVPRLAELFKAIIKHEVYDILVLPSMEDVPFPVLKKKGKKYTHQVPTFMEADIIQTYIKQKEYDRSESSSQPASPAEDTQEKEKDAKMDQIRSHSEMTAEKGQEASTKPHENPINDNSEPEDPEETEIPHPESAVDDAQAEDTIQDILTKPEVWKSKVDYFTTSVSSAWDVWSSDFMEKVTAQAQDVTKLTGLMGDVYEPGTGSDSELMVDDDLDPLDEILPSPDQPLDREKKENKKDNGAEDEEKDRKRRPQYKTLLDDYNSSERGSDKIENEAEEPIMYSIQKTTPPTNRMFENNAEEDEIFSAPIAPAQPFVMSTEIFPQSKPTPPKPVRTANKILSLLNPEEDDIFSAIATLVEPSVMHTEVVSQNNPSLSQPAREPRNIPNPEEDEIFSSPPANAEDFIPPQEKEPHIEVVANTTEEKESKDKPVIQLGEEILTSSLDPTSNTIPTPNNEATSRTNAPFWPSSEAPSMLCPPAPLGQSGGSNPDVEGEIFSSHAPTKQPTHEIDEPDVFSVPTTLDKQTPNILVVPDALHTNIYPRENNLHPVPTMPAEQIPSRPVIAAPTHDDNDEDYFFVTTTAPKRPSTSAPNSRISSTPIKPLTIDSIFHTDNADEEDIFERCYNTPITTTTTTTTTTMITPMASIPTPVEIESSFEDDIFRASLPKHEAETITTMTTSQATNTRESTSPNHTSLERYHSSLAPQSETKIESANSEPSHASNIPTVTDSFDITAEVSAPARPKIVDPFADLDDDINAELPKGFWGGSGSTPGKSPAAINAPPPKGTKREKAKQVLNSLKTKFHGFLDDSK